MKSTAGIDTTHLQWLELFYREPAHYGPPAHMAGALVALRDRRSGLTSPGIDHLAVVLQKKRPTVRKLLRGTFEDGGWLDVIERGHGRGRPTKYGFRQPGLPGLMGADAPNNGSLGTPFSPLDNGSAETRYPEGNGSTETRYETDNGSAGNRYQPPLLISSVDVGVGVDVDARGVVGRVQEAQVSRRGLAALADPAVRDGYYGLAELGLKAYDRRQRQLLAGAIAVRLDEGRTAESLLAQIALQLDRTQAGRIVNPWAFFLDRTVDPGPRLAEPAAVLEKCELHPWDDRRPCGACRADLLEAGAS